MPRTRALAPMAVVGALASALVFTTGCGGICYSSEVNTLTLRAELATTSAGGVAWASETMFTGDPFVADALMWEGAIRDASQGQATTGNLVLSSSRAGDLIFLALPFPMTKGATIPLVSDVTISNLTRFTVAPARDSVGVWFASCPDLAMPPCNVRGQTIEGAIAVTSVSPLRLRIDAVVSYPADAGRGPDAIAGDLSFSSGRGQMCRLD